MNKNNPNSNTSRSVPIGQDLLAVADALVEHRDIPALESLHSAIVTLILANVAGDDVSLIEINEYVAEAIDLLNADRSPSDVKSSSIRKLLGPID